MELPPNGHTLIEVCLVLLLISFIAGLSLTVVQLPSSLQVRSELERLSTVITYLQRKAQIEQGTYSISFDENSYTADTTWQLSAGKFGILPGVKGPPADPTRRIKEGCKKLTIGPDGITAGTVYLTDGNCLYALSSDASELSCLRKYRYAGKWEQL